MIILFLLSWLNQLVGQRLPQRCAPDANLAGYYWDTQQCLHCKEPQCLCSTYKGCERCADNYYLNTLTSTCENCPIGCGKCCRLDYVTQLICTVCIQGYSNVHGVCIKVDGCLTFSSHGHCMLCDGSLKYFRNNNNTCSLCPVGCSGCYSETFCFACNDGFYLETEYDKNITDDQQRNSFVCHSCNGASSTSTSPAGCAICTKDLGTHFLTCNDCLAGYFFIDDENICVQCPVNCKRCFTSRSCSICIDGYLPAPAGGPPPNTTVDAEGCHSCQDRVKNCSSCHKEKMESGEKRFVCDICNNTFYLSDDKLSCLPCRTRELIGVARCDSPSKVTECQVGYILITVGSQASCIKNINGCKRASNLECSCTECEEGLVLLRNVTTQIQFCLNCTSDIDQCLKCSANPDMISITCSMCNNSYYGDSNMCKPCVDFCAECNQVKCTRCDDGYTLNLENDCDQCLDRNCINCLDVLQCIKCKPMWGVSPAQTCWKCQLGCLECSGPSRATCSKCDSGYFLSSDGACLQLPEKCLKANIYGFCYLCSTQVNIAAVFLQFIFPDPQYDEFIDEKSEIPPDEGIIPMPDETENPLFPDETSILPLPDINADKSMFYKSVNGYCLICSDYDSGVFNCPNQCVEPDYASTYSSTIRIFSLIGIVFLS